MDYSNFIKRATTPIFYWPEWLDAVCQGDWQVELFKNSNGEWIGALPYMLRKRAVFDSLQMPPYTPYLGPLEYINAQKIQKAYSQGFDITERMIEFLKHFDEVNFRLRPGYEYWLPLRWGNYNLSPRITYQVPAADVPSLWDNLDARVRTDLRKAQEKSSLTIEKSVDLAVIYQLYSEAFSKNSQNVPMTLDWFKHFDQQLGKISAREIWVARQGQESPAAMVYLVEDMQTVYLFLTGVDPAQKKSSALSLLIWQGIQNAAAKGKTFDFEGSIIPGVEYFFRGFGGRQKMFFDVKRTNNRFLGVSRRLLEGFR